MDCDSLLPDELDMFEDRQDLSQYSYDSDDRLSIFPESQSSSQPSDKADVFLGVFDDHPLTSAADDYDGLDLLACLDDSNHEKPQPLPVMSDDTAYFGETLLKYSFLLSLDTYSLFDW